MNKQRKNEESLILFLGKDIYEHIISDYYKSFEHKDILKPNIEHINNFSNFIKLREGQWRNEDKNYIYDINSPIFNRRMKKRRQYIEILDIHKYIMTILYNKRTNSKFINCSFHPKLMYDTYIPINDCETRSYIECSYLSKDHESKIKKQYDTKQIYMNKIYDMKSFTFSQA